MDRMLNDKKWLRYTLILSVIITLFIFILNTDFKTIITEISKIGNKFIYILASTVTAYILGTIGWWVCLGEERKNISIWRLFVIRQLGETVGLYNPSSIIGGDLLKNELLKSYNLSKSATADSIIVSRLTAVLSQLLLFIVSTIWLFTNTDLQFPFQIQILILVILSFLIVLKSFILLSLNKKNNSKTPSLSFPNNLINRIRSSIQELIRQSRSFFQEKNHVFWLSYVFFLLHWLVGSIEFYLILIFMGFDLHIMHGLLLDMGVIIFKSVGAFIPGQLGVEELGNKLVLNAIGIQSAGVWLAVSILRRSRQLFWIMVGFICYFFVKKTPAFKLMSHGSTIR
ncbi:lysylphosphatidylglycerol synthase transmembrane domain-containing protein [Sphingobacterium sp. LRF_L2]|uniref:lysylphosphatidylglycerol synthase transmembrane domain-containing protein n=1 Tax=Sphingobacterium sp. LRF_L2 TaxID=3369421 RepID=UPI003F61F42A